MDEGRGHASKAPLGYIANKLLNIDGERRFATRLTTEAPWPDLHEGHVCGQRRKSGQELCHILAKVAHVSDVGQLAGARYSVHLHEGMHESQ